MSFTVEIAEKLMEGHYKVVEDCMVGSLFKISRDHCGCEKHP